MKLEYFVVNHLGAERKYVKDKLKRMWLTKLTKHATITDVDAQALDGLGIKLIKVKKGNK